ncbi:MAG: hypothetical protein ACJ8GW_10095 [Massilia sp.]
MMEMPAGEWVLLGLGALALVLDVFAIRKVFVSPYYDRSQRWAQAAVILFIPLFGAYLALFLAREKLPPLEGPPADHVRGLDVTSADLTHF